MKATLSHEDFVRIQKLNFVRLKSDIRDLSTGIVYNENGTGRGSASAGTPEEIKLAKAIKKKMKQTGVDKVKLEKTPVQTLEYSDTLLEINGINFNAISLHGAGASYGTDNNGKETFFKGNSPDKRSVVAELVDVGLGRNDDYAAAGDVKGKVVVIRRLSWPVYEIIEAKNRGAVGMLMWGYGSDEREVRSDLHRQDAFYMHLQIPVLAISKDQYNEIRSLLDAGTVSVTMRNRLDIKDGYSYNVVGTIRGALFPDEYIVCSAHYDRWFVAAADNCSGTAAILELARFFARGERPNRSFIFLAVGAEEAGIYNSTNDWLAGSFSFANAHPKIWRNIVHAINFDIYGFSNNQTSHQTSGELIPFQEHVVAEAQKKLGVTLPVTISEYSNSNVDAWIYCKVAGGGVVFQGSTQLFGEGPPSSDLNYALYYHTNGDVYEERRFSCLEPEMYYTVTGLLLADKSLVVPIRLSNIMSSLQESLNSSITANPDVDYSEVQTALDDVKVRIDQIEAYADTVNSVEHAYKVNSVLMNSRREFLPWLYSASGYRITLYNRIYAGLKTVLEAAEQNDTEATLTAITRIRGSGWWTVNMNNLSRFSPETVEEERLYYYANGDWHSAYDQKAELVGEGIDDIYYRLSSGESTPSAELEELYELTDHILVHLKDTLSLTKGKLKKMLDYYKDRESNYHV